MTCDSYIIDHVLLQSQIRQTPLHIACQHEHTTPDDDRYRLQLVTILLAHGAKVGVRDERGLRPIHCAVRARRWDMALLLMGFNADA